MTDMFTLPIWLKELKLRKIVREKSLQTRKHLIY